MSNENKQELERKRELAWINRDTFSTVDWISFASGFDAGVEAMQSEFNRMYNYYLIAKQKELEIESLKAEIAKRDELLRESLIYIYGDDSDSFEMFISKVNLTLKENNNEHI